MMNVPNVYIYYVFGKINIWDTVHTFIHLLRMILLTDIFNNEFDNIQWPSFILDLHTKKKYPTVEFQPLKLGPGSI